MSLLTSAADGILTLTLNRPGRLNAIDDAVAQALLAALRQASISPEIRVIVLRGAGRAFCAGRDVSEPPTDEILQRVQDVSRALIECPQPVLVGVQGWAVGAGLEWMLDADVAVAARSARFKLPEASLGVFVTGGISTLLPRCVGLARAKALLLLGDAFGAEDAERWGLVARVVDDAALDQAVDELGRRLAALDPAVASRFKRVLNQVGQGDVEAALEVETRMQRELMARAAGGPVSAA